MQFLIVNLLILLGCYLLTFRLNILSLHGKIVVAGFLAMVQIIFTEIILGILGILYLPALIFFNLGTALGLFFLFVFLNTGSLVAFLKKDFSKLSGSLKTICVPENLPLILLAGFVGLWVFVAAYFLPPRTVDDLRYHLTPIYEFIVNHKIFFLPFNFLPHFAFPFNAEFLFMWPAIFSHSQQFVDMVQFAVALWGIAVIYALARAWGIKPRAAFFVSLLFLFTPVVLAQSGSCYIDIITCVFYLVLLYFSIMFYKTRWLSYFYLTAIASGLLLGMKYNMLFLILAPLSFLFPALRTVKKKHLAVFLSILLATGGFWYIRNILVLKAPFYPMYFSDTTLGLFAEGPSEKLNIWKLFAQIPQKLVMLGKDAGLGSLHGGYGLTFWGIAFPAWIYIFVRSLGKLVKEKKAFDFWLSFQLIIGFFQLMLIPFENLPHDPRYSLFVVPIGLLTLGYVFDLFKEKRISLGIIKGSCIVFSIFSVGLLSMADFPPFAVQKPIKDFISGKQLVESQYLPLGGYMPQLCYMWPIADYLGMNEPQGIVSYLASEIGYYWTSPLYGTHLQNRVWNIQKNPSRSPDVLFYQYSRTGGIQYLGKKILLKDAFFDPQYVLVAYLPRAYCLIRKEILDKEDKRLMLAACYKTIFEEQIPPAEAIKDKFEQGIPIITAEQVGYGVKYFELRNELACPVYFVPLEFEKEFIDKKGWGKVYTTNHSLEGYSSAEVLQTRGADNKKLVFYKNIKTK